MAVHSTIRMNFSKFSIELAEDHWFHQQNPWLKLDPPSHKTFLFLIAAKTSINFQKDIRSVFLFENIDSYIFSIEKIKLLSNQFILTEIVNPKYRKLHLLYKNG